ncbi:MAG: DUF5110 domain-containing protein [Prolixibacteraceae bacterium]|nr:DUF5110 domain-containing protein [Prolixibacteraceae bacterium]
MKKFNWFLIFLFLSSGVLARSLYTIDGNKVTIDLEGIGMKSRMLRVEIWSPRAVKLISGMQVEFSDFNSLVANDPDNDLKFKVGYSQNNIEITTSELLISIQEDGLARIYNRDGNKMVIESGRTFDEIEPASEKYRIKQRFFLNPDEHIYGFGLDTEEAHTNLRNLSFDVKQDTENIATPLFYSERGYALLWDNYSATRFTDTRGGLEIESALANEIQYFFIYGPHWNDIVSEIRNITGNAPMLPRWAFGHWLLPVSSQTVEARANNFTSANIPVEPVTTKSFPLYEKEMQITASTTSASNSPMLNMAAYDQLKPEYEKLSEETSEERLCIPTHTNFPGIQKYGTFLLTNAKIENWGDFENQVISGINLSLSGQPYWSTSGAEPFKPAGLSAAQQSELMLRWYQYAAFNPVFISPPGAKDLINGNNPSTDYTEQLQKAIKLRYHLLPYIYSTARKVATKNKTFVRSLLFDYPEDKKVYKINRQFMFGESMMVCPVVEPNTEKMQVYLPEGNDWYNFHTGIKHEGGTNTEVEVSKDYIPLFVKAGSIVPFATIGSNTTDSLYSPVEIRIYPGDDATFSLYDDTGNGQGYLNGQGAVINFSFTNRNNVLVIDPVEGEFPGMPAERLFRVVVVKELVGNGMYFTEPPTWVEYDGKRKRQRL